MFIAGRPGMAGAGRGRLFIAGANDGCLATSRDGVTWTARTLPNAYTIRSFAARGPLVVAGQDERRMIRTSSGVTWTEQNIGAPFFGGLSAVYGGGRFVTGDALGNIYVSTDGLNWSKSATIFGGDRVYTLAYGGGLYVAAGTAGKLATSPDGTTWTDRTSGFGANFIYCSIYHNGYFHVGGENGFARSSDGVTWTFSSQPTMDMRGMTAGSGMIIACGWGSNRVSTNDGATWAPLAAPSSGGSPFRAIHYAAGLYVLGGASSLLYTSPDATTWTARTFPFSSKFINALIYA